MDCALADVVDMIDLPPRNVTNAVNGGRTAGREDDTAGSRTRDETVKPTVVRISVMRQLKRCPLSNSASRPSRPLRLRSRRQSHANASLLPRPTATNREEA